MKTILQILFFFLLVTQICFAQWYPQNSGTTSSLNSVHFENANNGWVVGDSGIILHTTNGGQEWLKQNSGTILPLNSVYFNDANKGWAVGGKLPDYPPYFEYDSSIIIHTTNGGITWDAQLYWPKSQLSSVFFMDANKGWAVGYDSTTKLGIIYNTTNGGTNWSQQFRDSGFRLNDIFMEDPNNGFAVGQVDCITGGCGGFIKTTDGGFTWTLLEINSFPLAEGLAFIRTGVWCSVGGAGLRGYGKISLTTDDFITWNTSTYTQCWVFYDVTFINNDTGWVVGNNGTILITTNGATDWTEQLSGTTESLYSVYFTDVNRGWIVGGNGTILYTNNGGVTFVEEEKIDEIPTEFLLSNNYPNPFNPSSSLSYSIAKSVLVTLKVYDVLGTEIETLVNEEKSTGTYELNWNASNLPSGVYFYRLQAGDFVQTRKMILLK